MREKKRSYAITETLLMEYRDAALTNAQALLAESSLLLAHMHHARAYFLAVAAIEEIGKAVLAHDGLGRGLRDPAIQTRLRLNFEDHSQKVANAFLPWLMNAPDLREQLMAFVNTTIDVKNGREPSMYVDVHEHSQRVVIPSAVVRDVAAKNCLDLAHAVLAHAQPYITETPPRKRSRSEDFLFSLPQEKFLKMTNTSDFWEYFIARARLGIEFSAAVREYYQSYFALRKTYAAVKQNNA